MSAPNKEERNKCRSSVEQLWSCLDKNENDHSVCNKEKEYFESVCSLSWINYFNRRRDYLKFKDKMENKGFEPIKS